LQFFKLCFLSLGQETVGQIRFSEATFTGVEVGIAKMKSFVDVSVLRQIKRTELKIHRAL